MIVSAIVPTLGRHDDLAEMVESLVTQTAPVAETVVVDAGSDERVQPMLARRLESTRIRLRYARSAAGTSLQRNRALDLATGDALLFLDDDVVLTADFLARCLEALALPWARPVGGVMGTFLAHGRPLGAFARAYHELFGMSHAAPGDRARRYASRAFRTLVAPSRVVEVPVASGGRTLFRRACFDGGVRFAEYLPGYTSSEDVELSHRIAERWAILQSPVARLHHKRSAVGRLTHADHVARLLYGRFYFHRTHMPRDRRHRAAFAWSTLGTALWCLGAGARRGPGAFVASLDGLVTGARLCRAHAPARSS